MSYGFSIAQLEDLPRIVEIKMAMFDEANLRHVLADNAPELVLEDYKDLYSSDEARHFIVRSNRKIVASVGAFVKSDLPFRYYRTPYYGFIGDVYTEPEYRGNGFASQLNNNALEWFSSKGISMIRLLAAPAAESIYKNLGFEFTDEMVLKIKT